jgi:hypothetical protein
MDITFHSVGLRIQQKTGKGSLGRAYSATQQKHEGSPDRLDRSFRPRGGHRSERRAIFAADTCNLLVA